MHAVFGPVLSRRLGRSLGVDPVVPKTCNWNCVHCQLGRTRRPQTRRRDVRPIGPILRELEILLEERGDERLDWITIVGSGEPTLARDLGSLVEGIKARTKTPLAVITNGSLLWRRLVRSALLPTDAVLPSLAAGSEELFQRIHRPAPDLSLRQHVDGLRAFRRAYRGKLWLEVMLLHGVNTTPAAISDLGRQIARIEPDAIHLTLPTRPPAERWVRPATEREVERVAEALSEHAPILAQKAEGAFEALHSQDPVDSACELVARHPVSEGEMRAALEAWAGEASAELVERLASDERVRRIERRGHRFWVVGTSEYGRDRVARSARKERGPGVP